VTLSDLIRSHGWVSNNEVVEALQQEGLEMMAEWVRAHPSADSIFGLIPGVSYYADQHGVTDAQAAQIVACIADHPWFFNPILDHLKRLRPIAVPVDHTITHADLSAELAAIWPDHGARFCDRVYSVCTTAALRDAIAATGYRYGAWVEETQDCDEWAGRLWGALQRTVPGNLAIGYVTICGNLTDGSVACHALLLAYTAEGWCWIENTGQVYPVGDLPGWDRYSIELDVGVF
jgi:hypothetical protein